jgi:hypothetical protein
MARVRERTGRIVLLLAFVLALGFTAFHAVRTVRDAIYWRAHRDEPIQGWMTLGFVSHSYHLPPHVLPMALGLPPGPPPDRRPLEAIARAQGRTLDQVVATLRRAIVHARPPYPPPPPPPAKRRP